MIARANTWVARSNVSRDPVAAAQAEQTACPQQPQLRVASLARHFERGRPALRPIASGAAANAGQFSPGLPVRLTDRQLDVLALLCEGLSNKLICRELKISTGTVKCHITSIFRALNVRSRVQAFLAAQALGLVGALPRAGAACWDDPEAPAGRSGFEPAGSADSTSAESGPALAAVAPH